ncbi:MAG: AAC(3) family N-acetyltransferase [Lachnospiraceae bacterium]|nr:AAC(3) family N-acetyltransferase [Candidatus Colinaster scatohippi]
MSQDFSELLEGLDIKKGDIIDVASDMASIMVYYMKRKIKCSPDAIIDMLKTAVGEEGTLMIRTFNWDYCHGSEFDIRVTPGKTGLLGNAALKRDDFKRTRHPLYSWMVWGKDADKLVAMDNISAFGEGTPFEYLYENHGKQLCLGNAQTDACTQLHHAETVAKVPYRYNKPFEGMYTDIDGHTEKRIYTMPVRPFDVSVQADEFFEGERYEFLEKKGIAHRVMMDGILRLLVIDLHSMQDFVVDDLLNNDGKNMIAVNGERGYIAAGIDYSKARFF